MARKKKIPSVAIDIDKFKEAMAALEKEIPGRFSMDRLPPFYLDALAPRFREGFVDDEIIAMMETYQVGEEDDLRELVTTLRKAFEAAETASKKLDADHAPASASNQAKDGIADPSAPELGGKRPNKSQKAATLSSAAEAHEETKRDEKQESASHTRPEQQNSRSGGHPDRAAEVNTRAAVSTDVTTGPSGAVEPEDDPFKVESGS